MAITEQKRNELAERNANIVKRYCNLSEAQPLASANKIINVLANEYGLTSQQIGRILRDNGIKPVTTPINELQL